ncbi:protein transport protein Sec24A-like [Lasioglossum baleicum]|uniref:protein transport protein Sec24A-like n=1 Tax=Lasioglossum baleicum TaxID=434251 RepID=UPI003FCE3D53
MQISIEENLSDVQNVCFQCLHAALLYTSSTGERKIRVHTLSSPVANIVYQTFSIPLINNA